MLRELNNGLRWRMTQVSRTQWRQQRGIMEFCGISLHVLEGRCIDRPIISDKKTSRQSSAYQRAIEHPQNISTNWRDISLHGFNIFEFYSLVKCPSWKLTVPPRLVKKFTGLYGTRRFITAFTKVRHLSLSWARSIHSTPNHHIHCEERYLQCIILPKPALVTCIYSLSDNPCYVEHKLCMMYDIFNCNWVDTRWQ
jgi:hypothetical protein